MSTCIFSTYSESFPVSHIVYVSFVHEIPKENRKGESTHSFKIITTTGVTYCYFKNAEQAKDSHASLEKLLTENGCKLFKNGKDFVDVTKITSFSKVIALKKPQNDSTHALAISLATSADEKVRQVWFHYKSEESATNARKALYMLITIANEAVSENVNKEEALAAV